VPNNIEKLLENSQNIQEEEVIRNLVLLKKIDITMAQELLNVKERRAREVLSNMVKKGILKKIGKTKGSYYILNISFNES
jgi:ATP-dependent DNA helicase RecG